MNNILNINNLTSGYNGKVVLKDISFSLKQNEVLAIIGQNGCGKSTLLKTIAREITNNSGEISFLETNLLAKNTWDLRQIGISWFIQGGLVFPTMKVKDHINLVMKKNSKEEAYRIKEECLYHFPSLNNLLDQRGGNLSGGQRQTLSLAMLYMQGTKCWLLDEPTAGLSPESVKNTIAFLQKMKYEEKVSMILVEHNLNVCSKVADRFLLIKEGSLIHVSASVEENIFTLLNNAIYE